MKLVKKLPRFSLVSLVFVFLLVVGGLFWFITDLLTEKQTEILTSKKDNAVMEIGGELNQIESLLISVGVSIENGADLVLVEATINDIADQNQNITQVFYGLEDGSYIITADNYDEDIDVTQRPWYIQAKNAGQSIYTNAYIDQVTNRPVITISVPVYDDDRLMGVIGADVSILTITAFLQDFEYEEGGYAFLLDASYQVIGHPSMQTDEDELLAYDDFDIPVDSFSQTRGITEYIETDGRTGKIAYQYINHSGFVFGIFMTRAELTQSVRTFVIASMAVLALFLVSFVIVIFIYRQHIEKPMDVLIQDINLIDVQNKPDYRLSISDDKSFKNARMALNTLIDTSVKYQRQLENSMAELSLENQKFESLLSSSSDIVFVIDKQGRYVNIYGSVKEAIGISKKALIGKTHEEVFGTKYAKERQIQYNRALKGERVLYSWESKTRGRTFYFENVINPMFNQENEIIGAVGVARDITEQENRYKQLVYISTHDYLTDLYNRKVYDDELEKLSRQQAYPFAVLNFDFNGLKLINDAYGHIYGDIALKKTAEILKQFARTEDIVCRVSGDEFSVIMPQAKKKDVDDYKHKIQQAFRKTKVKNISLSVAMGYFIQKDHLTSLDEVRKIAENNMYKQKILDRKSVKNKAISAILKTLTDKYDYEKKHSQEVMSLSIKIGKALNLDDEALKALGTAAMFHDIGKISLPDNILNKPGKLNKEEYEVIKTHTTIGYDILNTADEYSELAIHASSHHERYDGKGYPNGLKGDQIPLFSRIIAVADAYEAMTSDRPYRKKMDKDYARQEIIDHSGTQFDPLIAKIFVKEVLDKEKPSL
jgi:diguanylate cyclase (GGDEF)-like protein/PAS domain S-box-containing protein